MKTQAESQESKLYEQIMGKLNETGFVYNRRYRLEVEVGGKSLSWDVMVKSSRLVIYMERPIRSGISGDMVLQRYKLTRQTMAYDGHGAMIWEGGELDRRWFPNGRPG